MKGTGWQKMGWFWWARYLWMNHGPMIGIEKSESFPLEVRDYAVGRTVRVMDNCTSSLRRLLKEVPWCFWVTDMAVIPEYREGANERDDASEVPVGVRIRMQARGPRVWFWWTCRTWLRSARWKYFAKYGKERGL